MIRDYEPPNPSRIVNRILGSRHERMMGENTLMNSSNADYEAFNVTEGFPQMGFTLGVYHRTSKGVTVESHGILFHDVKKPKWRNHEGAEYVTFSHSGEAYTLRGHGLYELYLGLMNSTLHSALEYEPSVFKPLIAGAAVIDRVAVDDVAEMVRRSREDRENRGKH